MTATEELAGEYVFIAAFIRAGRPAGIFNVVGNIEQIQIRITSESVPGEPSVEEIVISPDEATIAATDEQQQLTATGIYSDGSREDLTTAVDWESSDSEVAAVDANGVVTAISNGMAIITAGYNGLSATSQITVSVAPSLRSISITAGNPVLTAENQTTQLRATGTYSDGSTLNLTDIVSWVSANPRIAEVSNSGLVTARNNGSTVITAALEGISGTITVSVNIPPALRTITIRAVGPAAERDGAYVLTSAAETLQLMAQGTYTDGSTRDITVNVTWSSSNPGVARVSSAGLVTAIRNGSATINAQRDGLLAAFRNITVDIPPVIQSLSISPSEPVLSGRDPELQLRVTGRYSDSTSQDVTLRVTWTTSNPSVATIDSTGRVRAVSNGRTVIRASIDELSTQITVLVNIPVTVQSVSIMPENPILNARNSTLQLTATAIFSDGSMRDVTLSSSWSSSNNNVATVSSTGLVTAFSNGSVVIIATYQGVTGNSSVTVDIPATLVSISISPSTPVIFFVTLQLTAIGHYLDSTSRDITTLVNWSSSNPSYAIVNSSGLVTAIGYGTATITASYQGITASVIISPVPNITGVWRVEYSILGVRFVDYLYLRQDGELVTGYCSITGDLPFSVFTRSQILTGTFRNNRANLRCGSYFNFPLLGTLFYEFTVTANTGFGTYRSQEFLFSYPLTATRISLTQFNVSKPNNSIYTDRANLIKLEK